MNFKSSKSRRTLALIDDLIEVARPIGSTPFDCEIDELTGLRRYRLYPDYTVRVSVDDLRQREYVPEFIDFELRRKDLDARVERGKVEAFFAAVKKLN